MYRATLSLGVRQVNTGTVLFVLHLLVLHTDVQVQDASMYISVWRNGGNQYDMRI